MSYTTYTSTGSFNPGGPPGISSAFLNAVETFLAAGWFDSSITSNHSGVLTVLGLVLNGVLNQQYPGSAQTLSNNSAITLPSGSIKTVTASSAVTGITVPNGVTAGDLLIIVNTGGTGNTVSFAGSNIRDNGNVSINAGHIGFFLWGGANWSTKT